MDGREAMDVDHNMSLQDIKNSLRDAEEKLETEKDAMLENPNSILEAAQACTDLHEKAHFQDMSTEVLNARVFSKISESARNGMAQLKMGDTEIRPEDLVVFFNQGIDLSKNFNFDRVYHTKPLWKNALLEKNSEPITASQSKKSSQIRKPEIIEEEEEEETEETVEALTATNFFKESSHYVKVVRDILKRQPGPVSLFNFAFNPGSYARTVENLYYLSFLVRDGNCKISEEDNNIWIEYSSQKASKEDFHAGFIRKSFILSLEIPQWQTIVIKYGIVDSILPEELDQEPSK